MGIVIYLTLELTAIGGLVGPFALSTPWGEFNHGWVQFISIAIGQLDDFACFVWVLCSM